MHRRACAACNRYLRQSSYTNTQWNKGDGLSRCMSCVHGHYLDAPTTEQSDGGRYNQSKNAIFENNALKNPMAEGSFRWVAKGKYTAGPRQDQACVAKWFKSGAAFSDDYFKYDILAVDKARETVNRFNHLRIVNQTIKINVPGVWTFAEDCSDDWKGQKCLTEPFIQNYQKFNSNSGWNAKSTTWSEVMQALSHFSYHVSGGMYVLCDLQGGIYQHEVVLSDPVIPSRHREYGVTDLGADGISSFFSNHECNGYCRSNWTRPANPTQIFQPTPRTTMIKRIVPTAHSRPIRTLFQG
ncbi:kinase-like protein [Trichoderma barbatum]